MPRLSKESLEHDRWWWFKHYRKRSNRDSNFALAATAYRRGWSKRKVSRCDAVESWSGLRCTMVAGHEKNKRLQCANWHSVHGYLNFMSKKDKDASR